MARSFLTRPSPLATAILSMAAGWALVGALGGILFAHVGSVFVWRAFDCWPLGRSGAARECRLLLEAAGWTWFWPTILALAALSALVVVVAFGPTVRAVGAVLLQPTDGDAAATPTPVPPAPPEARRESASTPAASSERR
jgi:hypothetical protein